MRENKFIYICAAADICNKIKNEEIRLNNIRLKYIKIDNKGKKIIYNDIKNNGYKKCCDCIIVINNNMIDNLFEEIVSIDNCNSCIEYLMNLRIEFERGDAYENIK